jgi:uncharacterized protein (TIGR02246 family)
MSTEIRRAIEVVNEKLMTGLIRADAAAMAALYTEDAQLLPPNVDVVVGQQAIQAFWQGGIDLGFKSSRLETLEVQVHGAIAVEVGTYTVRGPDEQVLDTGKYLVVWKQDAGRWKLHRDIFNSSRSATGN